MKVKSTNTKKGDLLMGVIVIPAVLLSIYSMIESQRIFAFVGLGMLISAMILIAFISRKPIGWHGLTKEKVKLQ